MLPSIPFLFYPKKTWRKTLNRDLWSTLYTPTWIVAVICSIIVLISLVAERGLHHLGKFLKRRRQDALYEALQKLQEDASIAYFERRMGKYDEWRCKARLPKFAIPKRYDLYLKPDLDTCKFSGGVHISLDILQETNIIVLNAADLSVDPKSVRFQSKDDDVAAVEVELFEDDEILVLEFGQALPLGLGVLSISSFQGTLNDQMKGFYRSKYEHNGEKKNMAVTQFEPADARRCFPCWDEPACKATFKITLEVPSELVALSNMPVVEEKVNGDVKIVSYQESPIMSTYLVAAVVGLFDYVEDHTPDGIKVRVYCQVGKANQGKFALDVAVKTLGLYKEYFATPYSLPKLDMIAIPDFAAGAMENYGLVTYRETALLYDDKHSAAANKQRVATVVAHELAHQWFGNLVTMEWWTHLWLNEGFATWVSYLAADGLFPEWKIWTQFLDESTEGLRLDGLSESHPIEVEINHAREIDEIFDAISYRKGASVIRMLQSYLGPDVFQRALAKYIKKHACSNAKTEDLWTVLEEESNQPVNKLMNSWTKQMGYPVVSVSLKDNKLEFEQKSFLLEARSQTVDTAVLFDRSVSDNESPRSWIKINVDGAGFYRVKYDDHLSGKIRYAIESKSLSAMDRYGILDDSFALSMAGQLPLSSLLTLMGAYREEPEYTVLSNLITISSKVARVVADANSTLLDNLKIFFINLYQNSAERIGFDPKQGESHLDALLRGELFATLAVFGHEETLEEASKCFQAYLEDRNTDLLPPDIRRAVYVAVMKKVTSTNRSGFDSLLKVYRETDLSQEKTRILGALGSCSDPDIILEVLNFLLTPEVRSQDAVFGLAVSREGREVAWNWLKLSSYEKVKEVEEFFASRAKPSIARTLKQSIERVQINAKWVETCQNEKSLADCLQELAYRKY